MPNLFETALKVLENIFKKKTDKLTQELLPRN